ncbi:MAG TPA: DUF5691 domain-containing protein [Methylomirabilota bacterium]|nr:DUF5691 domain-containing protein [Methylomirabilota bacterium]
MSLSFDSLVQIALLGTERSPLPQLVGETKPLGQLQERVQSNASEKTLLQLAAITSIHWRAGALPLRESRPMAASAALETRQQVNDRASTALAAMLDGRFDEMFPEWLRIVAETGQIARPEALPRLMARGTARAELRADVVKGAGERGLWLAQQNPDWSWLIGAVSDPQDYSLLDTGLPAVRAELLRRLRRSDAKRAREWLISTWKSETPEDRALLLEAMGVQLSSEDEELLEEALADKRKEIRKAASKLLARLPESRFAKRMRERADELLCYAPAVDGNALKLKRAQLATLEVLPPAKLEAAWQRDGIEAKAPKGVGEKAWWLIQILEMTPLSHWQVKWRVTAAEVIAASSVSEWKSELIEGWIRAALLQRNAEWAGALFAGAMALEKQDQAERLLDIMSAAGVESALAPLLEAKAPAATLLLVREHSWSAEFSRKVLNWLRAITELESYDWQTRNHIPELAARLHPDVLNEVTAGWPSPESKGWEFWHSHVEQFVAAAEFRRDMLNALYRRT